MRVLVFQHIAIEHPSVLRDDDWLNPPAIDQRTLFEGNSILRGGREPVIEEPKVKRSMDAPIIE